MVKNFPIISECKIKVPRFNDAGGFYATIKSSAVMRSVKSHNSKAEIIIRTKLWNQGLRYKVNNMQIFGRPDIVFGKKKVAIFVDGDFWHGYNWKIRKKDFKSNQRYWIPKIERNIQRDNEVKIFLENEGWKVLRFWEHEILKAPDFCIEIIKEHLHT